jgi:hypothetical protein
MPGLNAEDAVELAEMLQFLGDWLDHDHDHDLLAASLARFVGAPGYGPASLREDFTRFAFPLGATDCEGLSPRTTGNQPLPGRPGLAGSGRLPSRQ